MSVQNGDEGLPVHPQPPHLNKARRHRHKPAGGLNGLRDARRPEFLVADPQPAS